MSKKETKKIKTYREIQLLNLPEKTTGSYIAVYANGSLNKGSNQSKYEIKISDCINNTLLHGKLDNPKSRKNAIAKIDGLVNVLNKFKDHLVNEFKENNVRF